MRLTVGAGEAYASISAALDGGRAAGEPCEVYVRAGVYREKLVIDVPSLTLRGEGAQRTRIVYGDSAHMLDENGAELTTFRTATLRVHADGVTLRELAVENDAGPGEVVEQAMALYIAGDRCRVEDCALMAHQDTLLIGPDWGSVCDAEPCGRRAWLQNCLIRGNTDFIFGSYAAWFERCTLWCVEQHKPVNAMIAAPNTPKGQRYGFVFHRCTITGDCAPGTVYLGRPWRPYGQAAFLHCEMDAMVAESGWLDWETPFRPVWEGLCETEGAHTQKRHPGAKLLSAQEAKERFPREAFGF